MAQPENKHLIPQERLFQKMSEVISLREQVAQAELAARVLGETRKQHDENAKPEK